MSGETLSGKEARQLLRMYRKVLMSSIGRNGGAKDFFSKIMVNDEMYKELVVGVEIPKGHVAVFDGLPLQSSKDLPYGSIVFVPKWLTVEVALEEKVH